MNSRMYPQGSQAVKSAEIESSPTVTDLVEVRDATKTNLSAWVSILNLAKKLFAVAKTADYTVTANDSGKVLTNRGASGAVTFTLPTPANGLWFIFAGLADQNIVIAATGKIVSLNDATADTLTASTSSEKIGAVMIVVSDGTSWYALPIAGTWTVGT